MGNYKDPNICPEEDLKEISKILQKDDISVKQFYDAVKNAKKGDFVYFDPPYYPLNRTSSFTKYTKEQFLEKEQEKLAEVFKELDKKGCKVMLSNSDTDFIKNLYKGYHINLVKATRMINCDATKRGKINEVVITNYPTNIHTKPDDVSREMDYLADVVKTSGNIVVIGDLNADCDYYDNSDEEKFDNWNWLILDNQDTTSSSTNCAYDRIILNDDANAEAVNHGIYSEGITKEISDHYLIWVEFILKDISIDLDESPKDPTPSYIPKTEEKKDTQEPSEYVCSSDYYNCGDFNSHSEAQAVFDYCKSQGKGDIHRLDNDNDNNPCESLS